ncbi:hypothetical protein Tco_0077460 [Tanacetum coccineum]
MLIEMPRSGLFNMKFEEVELELYHVLKYLLFGEDESSEIEHLQFCEFDHFDHIGQEGKGIAGLAGAEKGSFIVISFKVSALNVDFDFKLILIDTSELSAEDFTNIGSFSPELEKFFLLASAIRALTSVTSFSSDNTSSSSQSYVSAMRPLFLLEDELGAEALELRGASLEWHGCIWLQSIGLPWIQVYAQMNREALVEKNLLDLAKRALAWYSSISHLDTHDYFLYPLHHQDYLKFLDNRGREEDS